MKSRSQRAALSLPAVPAALLAACAPQADAPPLVVERDSAGIAIIESHGPAWGDSARWRIDSEPLLDLAESGSGDPHNFYSVRGLLRMSDGSLVVANRGTDEIRKFSAEGSYLAAAGGSGEGPGEFSNLQRIELAGDSVVALDWDGKAAMFGPDLELVRTYRLDSFADRIRYLGDGRMLIEVNLPEYDAMGLARHPAVLLLADLEGRVGDTIGWTPGREEYSNDVLSANPLFGKESVLDNLGDAVYLGSSDHMQVEQISGNGDTVRIMRIPDHPLELTADQVEAERQARLNFLPGGVESLPPYFVQAVEDMPAPAARPAYSGLLVDPTGAVWLRPFVAWTDPAGPEEWTVLGSDGVWLGNVEIPEGFTLLDVGLDEVLGIRTTELDEQHPQVLRLTR